MTVSHAIVILLILTCQLAPKSNSHISHPLMRLYKYQYSFNATHFNFVQQCIQISTRINSSMYIRTSSFVSFKTYPIFNRFECSNWRCRHHDVKCIIFSCRNDIMNPYKRSCLDWEAVLWLLTANWTVSRVCPTMCSPGTIPEVPTVFLVK